MAQPAAQFTPAQILAAGRRAEADGRLDDAAQFYAHITEHFRDTREADDAREAISRLALMRLRGAPLPPTFETNGAAGSPIPQSQDEMATPDAISSSALVEEEDAADLAQRLAAQRSQPASRTARSRAPSRTPSPRAEPKSQAADRLPPAVAPAPPLSPTTSATQTNASLTLPERHDAFLFGHVVSFAATTLGLGLAIVACALIIARVLAPTDAADILSRIPERADGLFLPLMVGVGLALAFVGQVFSALFATANAMRDQAVVRRAAAENARDRT